jgi:hypothetical protein
MESPKKFCFSLYEINRDVLHLYLKKNSITLSIETNLFITAMLSVVETIGVLPPRPKRMNY